MKYILTMNHPGCCLQVSACSRLAVSKCSSDSTCYGWPHQTKIGVITTSRLHPSYSCRPLLLCFSSSYGGVHGAALYRTQTAKDVDWKSLSTFTPQQTLKKLSEHSSVPTCVLDTLSSKHFFWKLGGFTKATAQGTSADSGWWWVLCFYLVIPSLYSVSWPGAGAAALDAGT